MVYFIRTFTNALPKSTVYFSNRSPKNYLLQNVRTLVSFLSFTPSTIFQQRAVRNQESTSLPVPIVINHPKSFSHHQQVRSFATPAENPELERELMLELIEKDGARIAVLGMNRPHAKNAMSRNLLFRLHNYIEQIKYDKTVRVVILRSLVPGIFCAGADLKERLKMQPSDVGPFVAKARALITEMENMPMPVIGANLRISLTFA